GSSYERGGPAGDSGPRAALARSTQPQAALQPGRQEAVAPESFAAAVAPESFAAAVAPESFAAAVALVRDRGESILANHLMDDVHLVHYEPGRIELRVTEAAPPNLASRFAAVLEKACGGRWVITISQQPGAPTLREQARAEEAAKRAAVMQHPL